MANVEGIEGQGEPREEMRVGPCPGCKRDLSFKLTHYKNGIQIQAGHGDPSCDWYKEKPDSMTVARAAGLVKDKQ